MTTPFPFVAGAVLTAAELNAITTLPINDQTASYTLVVGDVGKRVIMNVGSANTVTVDDSIFAAGDTIFIANKGAGTSTITAGAGVTINSASGLDLVTSQSGQLIALSASSFLFLASDGPAPAAGLELISTTTIGSAVSSVTVTGAFSATYDNYRIVVSGGVGSANGDLRLTFGATATGYYWAGYNSNYASASLTAFQGANAAFHYGGRTSANQIDFVADVFSPFLAKNTVTHSRAASTQTDGYANNSDGYLADTTSYTAFTLTRNTGTMTGGEVRVYAYKN
jgi:hypothetical protein